MGGGQRTPFYSFASLTEHAPAWLLLPRSTLWWYRAGLALEYERRDDMHYSLLRLGCCMVLFLPP